uniref:uncharacterized protein LOC122580485 n=1 Tax=Erigeron canadensis TaxID=72917 RepID=UPI001CB99D25|nr:uncharacterized protein LOC122580485 [Erigeron canadensis]
MPHQPPPPLLHRQNTTTQILHHTTTTIFSTRHHLLVFLFVSQLVFSFHIQVETILQFLTEYIDNNPSIKTHFHQFKTPPKPINHYHPDPFPSFFDDPLKWAFHRVSNDPQPKPELNATILALSSFVSENGPRVSEYIHSVTALSFRVTEDKNTVSKKNQDFFTIWLIVTVFLASYGVAVFGFLVTHSMVNGIIFVMIMIHFLKKKWPLGKIFRDGLDLGMDRLCWLYALRLVLMTGLTQLLGLCFFGNFYDPYTHFKIFVRLKFMPITSVRYWVEGLERDSYGFLFTWLMLDMYMSLYFSVDACVAIADSKKNGLEVIKEGYRLMSLMDNPATNLNLLQNFVCGLYVRSILADVFGPVFAVVIQSCMEAYFLVAWMMYYLCVKSMDANSRGVPFGQRELEAMLVDGGQ